MTRCQSNRSDYDARGLKPDAARMAEAHHVKRDATTDEISWPPSRMMDMLRDLAYLALQLAKVAALLLASYAFLFVFMLITGH